MTKRLPAEGMRQESICLTTIDVPNPRYTLVNIRVDHDVVEFHYKDGTVIKQIKKDFDLHLDWDGQNNFYYKHGELCCSF